jgi:hypothetical protein
MSERGHGPGAAPGRAVRHSRHGRGHVLTRGAVGPAFAGTSHVTLPLVIPRNDAVRWIIGFAGMVAAYAALSWVLLLE